MYYWKGHGISVRFMYAIVITIIGVLLTTLLADWINDEKEEK
jgi:uncharacterized membrane protein